MFSVNTYFSFFCKKYQKKEKMCGLGSSLRNNVKIRDFSHGRNGDENGEEDRFSTGSKGKFSGGQG